MSLTSAFIYFQAEFPFPMITCLINLWLFCSHRLRRTLFP